MTPSPQGRTKAFVGPLRQRLATFLNAGPARQAANTRQWASDRAGDLEPWAEVLEQLGAGNDDAGFYRYFATRLRQVQDPVELSREVDAVLARLERLYIE